MVSNRPRTVDVYDVLYVPSIFTNLISASRLLARGLDFSTRRGVITNSSGTVVGEMNVINNLFILRTESTALPVRVLPTVNAKKVSIDVWHQRLGHLNLGQLKQLRDLADGIEFDQLPARSVCESCSLSNIYKHYRRASATVTSEPFELVHSDVVGPLRPQGIDGSNYFISLTDDYTRYSFVRPIKTTKSVGLVIREFVKIVRT